VQVGTSSTFFSNPVVLELELELAAKQLEEAHKLAEPSPALPRVPAAYFEAGQITEADEDEWWSKQFGGIAPVAPPAPPESPRPRVKPVPYPSSIWGWH
jgi:hypothetical protein